jgi:hypothetical protein
MPSTMPSQMKLAAASKPEATVVMCTLRTPLHLWPVLGMLST